MLSGNNWQKIPNANFIVTTSRQNSKSPWLDIYTVYWHIPVGYPVNTTRFHFIPPIPTFAIIYNHPIVFLAARPKLGTPRSQKRTLKLGRETSDKTICSTEN